MKTAAYFLILISTWIPLQAGNAQTEQANAQNFSGEIMDDLCAKDKSHSKMMEQMKSMGMDPSVCSRKCVELGAKYVLFDRSNSTVYPIANQEKVEPFAGHMVRVSGTVEKKKLKVLQIEASNETSQKRK